MTPEQIADVLRKKGFVRGRKYPLAWWWNKGRSAISITWGDVRYFPDKQHSTTCHGIPLRDFTPERLDAAIKELEGE